MIAIVGGDGSGKTTAINGLYEWLGQEFEVTKVHMGKPRWSTTTLMIRGLLKAGRSLGLYPFQRAPVKYSLDQSCGDFPGYPWLFREACTARDRYLTYAGARRFSRRGGLVICDRFPVSQIKLMDGPVADWIGDSRPGAPLVKLIAALEKHYYGAIHLPEQLIMLRVDPEIAVRRKTDEDPDLVRARSTEVWELDCGGWPGRVLDAGRPRAEVLSELKTIVWAGL